MVFIWTFAVQFTTATSSKRWRSSATAGWKREYWELIDQRACRLNRFFRLHSGEGQGSNFSALPKALIYLTHYWRLREDFAPFDFLCDFARNRMATRRFTQRRQDEHKAQREARMAASHPR